RNGKDDIINIYPNPNRGIFNFTAKENGNYELINTLGKVIDKRSVVRNNTYAVDLSRWSSGIYLLRYTTESNQVSMRNIVLKK
ncbi:MAG: hypothetical protein COB88_06575, partial [Flavobacteriales bacterium]